MPDEVFDAWFSIAVACGVMLILGVGIGALALIAELKHRAKIKESYGKFEQHLKIYKEDLERYHRERESRRDKVDFDRYSRPRAPMIDSYDFSWPQVKGLAVALLVTYLIGGLIAFASLASVQGRALIKYYFVG